MSFRIRRARKNSRLTQEVVAERVGVTRGAMGHWEQGVTLPSTNHLRTLARVLNVPLDWLANGGPNPFETTAGLQKHSKFAGIAEPKGRYQTPAETFDKETLQAARKYYRLPKKQRKLVRDLLDQLLPN